MEPLIDSPEDIKYPEGLQTMLTEILGLPNVYFQPPSDISMNYPCIIYHLDGVATMYADNTPYLFEKRYLVTYVDQYPDTTIPDQIAQLPTSKFVNHYTADNLNHYSYRLYYKEVKNYEDRLGRPW